MNKRYLITGLFVLSGVALLLVLLFFLGLSDLFAHKVTLYTGFTESVQGLSRGSAVKYRGVQIGTVSAIRILVNEQQIQVDMEIEPGYFVGQDFNLADNRKKFDDFWKKELEKGLRARLEMLGITGMKYVDFDYRKGEKLFTGTPPRYKGEGSSVLYIPSVTSQMKDVTETLTMALDRISKINFQQIADNFEATLTGMNSLILSSELKSAIMRINDTAENLSRASAAVANVLDEGKLQQLTMLVEKNLKGLDELRKKAEILADRSNVPATTQAFRRAADNFSDGRHELANALLKLNQTLESVRNLADYLSRDPASLLRGKSQRPLMKSR